MLLSRLLPPPTYTALLAVLTLIALGLNPYSETSYKIAVPTLLIQLPLYQYVTNTINTHAFPGSSLALVYVVATISQVFLHTAVSYVITKVTLFLMRWAYSTPTETYTAIFFTWLFVRVERLPFSESLSHIAYFLLGMSEEYSTDDQFGSMDEMGVIKTLGEDPNRKNVAISKALTSIMTTGLNPKSVMYLLPTHIAMFYLLREFLKSYSERSRRKARDVVVIAAVMSLAIANVEIVAAEEWTGRIAEQGVGVIMGMIAVLCTYSCFITCGVVNAIYMAENAFCEAKHSIKLVLGVILLLGLLGNVLVILATGTWLSLEERAKACVTLVVASVLTGWFCWMRADKMFSDYDTRRRGPKQHRNR